MNDFQIGISYDRIDEPFVKQLSELLKDRLFNVFVDIEQYQLLVGKYLHEVLYDIFYNICDFAVLIISKDYLNKPHTMWEARTVVAKSIIKPNRFIVVIHNDVNIPEVSKSLCINNNYLFIKMEQITPEDLANIIISRF